MESRFDSCQELKNFSLLLNELRDKQKKLNDELIELRKDEKVDITNLKITNLKHEVIIKLLTELDAIIEDFNTAPKEKLHSEADKSAEFWVAVKLGSRVVHSMIENLHILMGYRNFNKPVAVVIPALTLTVGAFFAAPILSAIAAIFTLMCGFRLTAWAGFSKSTGYIGLPNSLGIFAKLADELISVACQLKSQASLPENISEKDLEAYYKILKLEKGTSSEIITSRAEELFNEFRQELINLNSRNRQPTSDDDHHRTTIADKTVEVMLADLTTSMHAMNHPQNNCKPS